LAENGDVCGTDDESQLFIKERCGFGVDATICSEYRCMKMVLHLRGFGKPPFNMCCAVRNFGIEKVVGWLWDEEETVY